MLDERVAERGGPVVDREGLDRVLAALEALARGELDRREWIRQAPEERLQAREQFAQPLRAVDRHPHLVAAAEGERLQHPRQPEGVVGMEVREEDRLEVGQPHRRALELTLRPLGAVEEQALAAPPEEERRGRALRGRHRRRRAEEDEIEVHRPPIVGSRAWRIRRCSRSTGVR